MSNGAVLSVSGRVDGKLNVVNGQTLVGSGIITGAVDVAVGATVAPGESINTLSASGPIVLKGVTKMEIDKTGAINDVLHSDAGINYGGTLNVTNLTQSTNPLADGDSFKLFDSATATYTGSFAAISPASPGAGLAGHQQPAR